MVLTFIALLGASLMAYLGSDAWGVWQGIELNPISLILAISGAGGIYTFIVRFFNARADLQAQDLSKPLSTPKDSKSSDE